MNTKQSGAGAVHRKLAFACIAALSVLSIADTGLAQHGASSKGVSQDAAAQVEQLEQIFWACDYVATVNGVQAAPVAACSAATESLKDLKFEGDFLQLLDWWRENKPAEHARLEAASAGADATAPNAEAVGQTRDAIRGPLEFTPYT